VPSGRLAEAEALLHEEHGPPWDVPPAVPEDESDPGYRRLRAAQRAGMWFFLLFLPPLSLFMGIVQLMRIRRQRRRTGWSPCLEKAWRMSLMITLVSGFCLGLFLTLIAGVARP
jgi:hypothetical protein